MIDFKIDNGRLVTDDSGNLICVNDADRVRQQLEFRLSLFQGEWFLDSDFGTPYFSDVLGKRININAAISVIKQQILEVEGVNKITEFNYNLERKERKLSIIFSASTDYGIVNYP